MNCQICGLESNGLTTSNERCKCPPPNDFTSYCMQTQSRIIPDMTLREYYAGLALQGLLSRPIDLKRHEFAQASVELADELIEALNEKEE